MNELTVVPKDDEENRGSTRVQQGYQPGAGKKRNAELANANVNMETGGRRRRTVCKWRSINQSGKREIGDRETHSISREKRSRMERRSKQAGRGERSDESVMCVGVCSACSVSSLTWISSLTAIRLTVFFRLPC